MVVLATAANTYVGLYRLAESGLPISPEHLSNFPRTLTSHIVAFWAFLIAFEFIERKHRKLRSNNSFKPNPLRGSA